MSLTLRAPSRMRARDKRCGRCPQRGSGRRQILEGKAGSSAAVAAVLLHHVLLAWERTQLDGAQIWTFHNLRTKLWTYKTIMPVGGTPIQPPAPSTPHGCGAPAAIEGRCYQTPSTTCRPEPSRDDAVRLPPLPAAEPSRDDAVRLPPLPAVQSHRGTMPSDSLHYLLQSHRGTMPSDSLHYLPFKAYIWHHFPYPPTLNPIVS
nr:uncharacterized protein LOC131273871 [Dasypus novemcinctus]